MTKFDSNVAYPKILDFELPSFRGKDIDDLINILSND